MTDARKMSNENLMNDLADTYDGEAIRPVVDELARRFRIMEEWCESEKECLEKDFSIMPWERKKRAEAAYRAMKGEQDAVD